MSSEAPTAQLLPLDFDPGPVPGSWEFAVVTPRRAVDPRGMVRAAEIWRLAQEAAVQGTIALGWSPERLRREQRAFVVSDMTVVHHRQAAYGERVRARTWVRSVHRSTLFGRELRLWSPHGPIAAIAQRWAHVAWTGPDALEVCPAKADLLGAMQAAPTPGVPVPALPPVVRPVAPVGWSHRIEVWHTWMDPLGHVNHPAYLDFVDEVLCRWVHATGGDAQSIVPVADRLRYRQAANATWTLRVALVLRGETADGAAVLDARILREDDGALLVRGTVVRRVPAVAALVAAGQAIR